MRKVTVVPPSFPAVPAETPLQIVADRVWQVLCGDDEHWRVGIWSPDQSRAEDCPELERHSCPEFFLLLQGSITMLLHDGRQVRQVALQAGQPLLVRGPHAGFCPQGPHTGRALVVERDRFHTLYRSAAGWADQDD